LPSVDLDAMLAGARLRRRFSLESIEDPRCTQGRGEDIRALTAWSPCDALAQKCSSGRLAEKSAAEKTTPRAMIGMFPVLSETVVS